MHILLIPSWYPKTPGDIGGSFFREQALALGRNGYQVGVIYPQLRSLRQWRSIFAGPRGMEISLDEGVPTYRQHGMAWLYQVPHVNSRFWLHHGLKLFCSYVEAHGTPDILHVHSLLNGGVLARAIKERFGVPYVVTEHSSAFERGLVKPWQKRLAARAVAGADRLVAVSEAFADRLNRCFAGDDEWRWIPNMLPADFAGVDISAPSREARNFTFCNVSLLTSVKGIDLLLQAFAAQFTGNSRVRLIIAGDGVLRCELEALASRLKVADQVDFPGLLNRDQVMAVMAASQAYVLSSRTETFGVSLIEAMALGKPVVATRCGGPESIVRQGEGLLVENGNVEDLAAAMQQLIDSYQDFDPQRVRQSCLDRFGEQAVIGQLSELYREVGRGRGNEALTA